MSDLTDGKNRVVHLIVRGIDDWFSIECRVCKKDVCSGDRRVLHCTVDELLQTAVLQHLHEGMG